MSASLRRAAADPMVGSVVVSLALIATGFATIALGWRGTATTLDVAEQVTYIVSAGIAAIGFVTTGLSVLLVQRGRRAAAIERAVLNRLVSAVGTAERNLERQR
jgi:hypothetical protein